MVTCTRMLSSMLAAILAFASVLDAQSSPRCLALGFGKWDGDTNAEHYSVLRVRRPSLVKLSHVPPEWFPDSRSSFDARVINRTGLRANLWTQAGDSLTIMATAALSDGWVLLGTLSADTLRGRVRATSDAVRPNVPRASAYGLFVACTDSVAIRRASAHIAAWIATAPRDSAALGREQRAEEAWWDELRRTGVLPPNGPPAAP